MNLSSSAEMETWYDKYNYFMVDLRDPRYVSKKILHQLSKSKLVDAFREIFSHSSMKAILQNYFAKNTPK